MFSHSNQFRNWMMFMRIWCLFNAALWYMCISWLGRVISFFSSLSFVSFSLFLFFLLLLWLFFSLLQSASFSLYLWVIRSSFSSFVFFFIVSFVSVLCFCSFVVNLLQRFLTINKAFDLATISAILLNASKLKVSIFVNCWISHTQLIRA